jgi:hypothetical protein
VTVATTGVVVTTAVVVSTATADRAGITVAEAVPSGSSRTGLSRSKHQQSRRIPGGFSYSVSGSYARKYQVTLLDIGGVLC